MSGSGSGRIPFTRRIPFAESLGLELLSCADGKAELRLEVDAEHLNFWNVAHGGVLMTMLDVAMAHAARAAPHGHGEPAGVATVEMKTSFMRPAEGRLRATGTLLHRAATMAFTEGSVFDESGRLCAHATATFKYLRGLPTKARPAAPTPDPERTSP